MWRWRRDTPRDRKAKAPQIRPVGGRCESITRCLGPLWRNVGLLILDITTGYGVGLGLG